MCGLAGVISTRKTKRNWDSLVTITQESLHRGKDASGFAWFDETNKKIYYAKGQSEPEKLALAMKNQPSIKCGIGHVRAMTIGEPTDANNNHPIILGASALIHNGMITNTDELEKKYPEMKMKGKVDSRWLLWVIEYWRKNGKTYPEAIQEACTEITGSYSFLMITGREPNKVYGVRNTRPVEFIYQKAQKTLYVASEKDSIKKIVGQKVQLGELEFIAEANAYHHSLDDETGFVLTIKASEIGIETFKVKPKTKTWPVAHNAVNHYSGSRGYNNDDDFRSVSGVDRSNWWGKKYGGDTKQIPLLNAKGESVESVYDLVKKIVIYVSNGGVSNIQMAHEIDLTAQTISYTKLIDRMMGVNINRTRYWLVRNAIQTAENTYRGKAQKRALRKLKEKLWKKVGRKLNVVKESPILFP